ncbi:hypothetical protein [Caballeronia glathei]|uniref:hypothetical protein n=1 Tax=Caballeronia glathei TaxID=60547 RepID=UPI001E5B8016|nr:hypothetical protein [Caballeronia glathei]
MSSTSKKFSGYRLLRKICSPRCKNAYKHALKWFIGLRCVLGHPFFDSSTGLADLSVFSVKRFTSVHGERFECGCRRPFAMEGPDPCCDRPIGVDEGIGSPAGRRDGCDADARTHPDRCEPGEHTNLPCKRESNEDKAAVRRTVGGTADRTTRSGRCGVLVFLRGHADDGTRYDISDPMAARLTANVPASLK